MAKRWTERVRAMPDLRVNLLLIDRHMNTIEVNIPRFMLEDLNYSTSDIKHHDSKRELNNEVSDFLRKFSD